MYAFLDILRTIYTFSSIRTFASALRDLAIPIDVLALNAGLSLSVDSKPPPPRTKDGYEVCPCASG